MNHPNFLAPEIRDRLWAAASATVVRHGVLPKQASQDRRGLSFFWEKAFLGLVLLGFLSLAIFGYPLLDGAYRVFKIYPLAAQAQNSFKQGNFSATYNNAVQINHHLTQLAQDTAFLKRLDFVPALGNLTKDLHSVVLGSQKVVASFLPALRVLNNTQGQIHDIGAQARREVVLQIANQSEELALSGSLLKNNRLPFVSRTLARTGENLQNLAYIAPELPALLGLEKEARYLLIFANNLEIRPGGGFIGTYGILTVKNAEIVSLDVRDVYNLPGPKDGRFGPQAPPIVQSSLGIKGFPFRDANWWPDYPTTAKVLKDTYAKEGGEYATEISGVITVTTDLLNKVVELTGPVQVGDVLFTKDNAVSELQKQVEVTFWEQGIPETRRKDIVGDLAVVLHRRITDFNFAQNVALLKSFADLADRNHIVFYFDNQKLQNLIAERKWDGSLQGYDSDTLMVVDANLIGFKTENLMEKNYSYNVRQENGKLLADLTLHYKHKAQFTSPLINNYRTYVRIYVPAGSKLLGSTGADSSVDVGSEGNRTVFGAFLVVPVGSERSVNFTYELPVSISPNNYSLFVQKQIGAYPFGLRASFNFDSLNNTINEQIDTNKIYVLNGRTNN